MSQPFFPGRVYRLGVADLHAYVEVLLSDAPIPARLHALRVLKPVIYTMLAEHKLAEKLPKPEDIYTYARLEGVEVEPPKSVSGKIGRIPAHRASAVTGEWGPDDVEWLFRQLQERDGEDPFTYLKRCAVLVSALFAKMRLLAGGLTE